MLVFRKSKKPSRGRPKNVNRSPLFTCKIRMCLEEFETMDALISHKTAIHRRIQCTYCPDLKLVVDLNKHLRTTHGINQKSMCERCGEVYLNTRSLQVIFTKYFIKYFVCFVQNWVTKNKMSHKKKYSRIIFNGSMKLVNHYNVIFARNGLKAETQYGRIWIMCMFKGHKHVQHVVKYQRIEKHYVNIKQFTWNHGKIVSNVSFVIEDFAIVPSSKWV